MYLNKTCCEFQTGVYLSDALRVQTSLKKNTLPQLLTDSSLKSTIRKITDYVEESELNGTGYRNF
jgi:hypothetical protein